MEYCKTQSSLHDATGSPTLPTREQRDEGRKMMEEAFVRLMKESRKGYIRWTGTVKDLMELTYIAYRGCAVRHSDGSPAPMSELVREICARLHVRTPANPYKVAVDAMARKGVRQQAYLERFCWLHFVAGMADPTDAEIERTE